MSLHQSAEKNFKRKLKKIYNFSEESCRRIHTDGELNTSIEVDSDEELSFRIKENDQNCMTSEDITFSKPELFQPSAINQYRTTTNPFDTLE